MSAARALELFGEAQALETQADILRAQAASELSAMRAAGMTVDAIGTAVGLSKQRVSQILAKHAAAGWGPASAPARKRESWLVEQSRDFQLARHAQEERALRASLGYETEMAAFYGDPHQSPATETEQRITWRAWISHAGSAAV